MTADRQSRCYTTAQVVELLEMNRRTFFDLKRQGRLPFLEEIRPRLGRIVRYRADRLDAYLAGKFQPMLVKRGA